MPEKHAGARAAAIAAGTLSVLYFASTVPTPLYPLYRQRFNFSPFLVTVIYAVYALGNLAALFFCGRLSDQIGRRRGTLPALVLTFASSACFLLATGTPWLFAARVLNGFAAGVGASALTAWLAELLPDRAHSATVATGGNFVGLAAGALVAGALAQHAPWPLRLSWMVHLALIAAALLLLRFVPETVRERKRLREVSFRPRIGVPRGIRLAFVPPTATAFAAFALGGFYAAIAPGMLDRELHEPDRLVIGAVVAAFFGSGAVTSAVSWRLRSHIGVFVALGMYLPALAVMLLAEQVHSLALLVGASALGGIAMALGFRGSLEAVNELAPPDRRAEVLASYLIASYVGNALPVVGVGLVALAVSAPVAHMVFAGVLVAIAVVAFIIQWRVHGPGRNARAGA